MTPDRNDPQKDQPGSEFMNLRSRRMGLGVTAWFDVDLSFEWDLDREYQELSKNPVFLDVPRIGIHDERRKNLTWK